MRHSSRVSHLRGTPSPFQPTTVLRVLTLALTMLAGAFAVIRYPERVVTFPYPTFFWVWGADAEGELGDLSNQNKILPHLNDAVFPAGTVLMSLAAGTGVTFLGGGSHSLAVDRNRNLWAWGHDLHGQVGDGHGGTDIFSPVRVCAGGEAAPCTQFLGSVTAMAAGGSHSLALDILGNVWAWGDNEFGQLGSDATVTVVPIWNVALFAQVNQHGRPPITGIAAGENHSLALDSGGVVWAWGSNGFGQLGVGSNDSHITVASALLSLHGTTITAIAAGSGHSLALDSQGHVWAWGDNHVGQLGIGSFSRPRLVPVKLDLFPPPTRITRIASGAMHNLATDSFGRLWAWGANEAGQLGIGTTTNAAAPALVRGFPGGTRIVTIAAGGAHSLAVDADGNLWSWGLNLEGQLGNGTTTESHLPARVIYPLGINHTIVSVAAGTRHSLALESLSFVHGLEAVLALQLPTTQALLLPQSLTSDAITATVNSSVLDSAGRRLLVTNTLTDTAGRKLVLTLIQQRDDRTSLVLEVQSVQYNDGVVMTPPQNRIQYHWNTDAGGAVASLEQRLELGQGAGKTEIVARYDKVKNQTVIHVALPSGSEQFTAPGLATLQTSTIGGNLGFSDGTHIWPREDSQH